MLEKDVGVIMVNSLKGDTKMIDKIINEFYHDDFVSCDELVINSNNKDLIIELKNKSLKCVIPGYDISAKVSAKYQLNNNVFVNSISYDLKISLDKNY